MAQFKQVYFTFLKYFCPISVFECDHRHLVRFLDYGALGWRIKHKIQTERASHTQFIKNGFANVCDDVLNLCAVQN